MARASAQIVTDDKGEIVAHVERDTPIEPKIVAPFSYGNRVRIAYLWQNYEEMIDKTLTVAGWAKTLRMGGKDFAFIALNDGSCSQNVQLVVDGKMPNFDEVSKCTTGCSFKAKGKLVKSPAAGQPFDLQINDPENHSIKIVGKCPGDSYPLAKKKQTTEYLREIAHLRPRTNLISAVSRVRNNLSYATHKFFQERGFNYIHTPLITASDCEGAGEMFQVTTVLPKPNEPLHGKVPVYSYEGQDAEKKEDDSAKKDKKKKDKKGKEEEKKEEVK